MSEATAKKKRKYFDGGGGKKKWGFANRPKRGAPGMLLTCETGRERKCQREGLEILNYYFTNSDICRSSNTSCSKSDAKDKDEDETTALSLEEELKLLQSKNSSSDSSAFGVYETSCRGTIFVLCTLPNCNLIPAIQTEYMLSKNNPTGEISRSGSQIRNDGDTSIKKIKTDKVTAEADKTVRASTIGLALSESSIAIPLVQKVPWDPISTIQKIISDIDNDSNKAAPRSRFVTRMIPMQATCFASSEELQLTCLEVIKRYFSKTAKTFAIIFKRRNCSNLNRNLVIKIVGDIMLKYFPHCKVCLGKPEATVMVEVCGTLCGVSIVENIKEFRNFNLMGTTTVLGRN